MPFSYMVLNLIFQLSRVLQTGLPNRKEKKLMVWSCSCKMNKKLAGCSPLLKSSMPTPCCHNNGNSNISISTGLLSTVRSHCSGSSLYISKTYTTQCWSSAQCLIGISNRIIHPKLRKSTEHCNHQNLQFSQSTRTHNFFLIANKSLI